MRISVLNTQRILSIEKLLRKLVLEFNSAGHLKTLKTFLNMHHTELVFILQ